MRGDTEGGDGKGVKDDCDGDEEFYRVKYYYGVFIRMLMI